MRKLNKWEVSEFGWHNISGVYCIYTFDILTKIKNLMYIGSSINIGKRIHQKNHPYQNLLQNNECIFIKFKEIKEPESFRKLEISLINRIRPAMNKMKYDYGTR